MQKMTIQNTAIKVKIYNLLLGLYIGFATLFFVLYAKSDIDNATEVAGGLKTFGLYADHPTYVSYFRFLKDDPLLIMLLKPNYIGPFIILYLTNDNLNYIFIFNVLCLLISPFILFKYLNLNRITYIIFLLINPVSFISLFSVNKEIITLLAVNIFIACLISKNKFLFLLSIIIGILAKKELSIFFISFYCLIWIIKNWQKHTIKLSCAIIILVSFMSFLIDRNFSSINDYSIEAEITVANSGSGGTILLLNNIQKNYGYFWVVIPKTILNLIGSVLTRTNNLFFFENVYNDVIIWGQSLLFIYVIPKSYFIYKKNLNIIINKLFFAFILSCILFSYIPVIQNRYFYTGYLLLITIIAYKPNHYLRK